MPQKTTMRRTTDLKKPVKNDGTLDRRYTTAQFVNKDGSRDMRTKLTENR
jgi:hypothetical protein